MTNIVIIDDHKLLREGLHCLFQRHPSLRIVGETSEGKPGIKLVERLRPDLLLLDLVLPGFHGFQFLRQLRRLTKTLVVSTRNDESFVLEAFRYGAAGYFAKEDSFAELLRGIDVVLKGERFISASLNARRILAGLSAGPALSSPFAHLTPREQEVLQMAAESCTNAEIAQSLSISSRTVEMHRANLMRKLRLRSHGDLIRYAVRNHIIVA